MSMFKKIKASMGYTAANKLVTKEAEYQLYEMVSNEIANGKKDIGVWTKAFTMSDGNEQIAEAKYIELMVERYKDLIEAGQEIEEVLKSKETDHKPQKEPSIKEPSIKEPSIKEPTHFLDEDEITAISFIILGLFFTIMLAVAISFGN